MHRLIAWAIGRDPSLVDKVTGVDEDWIAILAPPVSEVRRLLTCRSERMTRLRLSSPFAFVIDFTDLDLRHRIWRAARQIVELAFLSSLDRDIAQSPDCIKPLSTTRITEARELTKDVTVSDDEVLPDA